MSSEKKIVALEEQLAQKTEELEYYKNVAMNVGRDKLRYINMLSKTMEKRRMLQVDLKKSIRELSKALTDVKTLEGLLPICANCKKIRDKNGVWDPLEDYIEKRSDAAFSHGICPACLQAHHPDLADDRRLEEQLPG